LCSCVVRQFYAGGIISACCPINMLRYFCAKKWTE